MTRIRRGIAAMSAVLLVGTVPGCDWRGLNSLPLPGTAGGGPGAFTVTAQLPDVTNIQPNSRVRVGDVTVGNVVKIERQGWHALATMKLNDDVQLPANATASVGQTSLLGTLHIELAPPTNAPPEGRLHDGSQILLSSAGAYPTVEQTLSAIALLFNGGGIGKVQDITAAFSTALRGREGDLRDFNQQIDLFMSQLNGQRDDILAANESVDNLVSQFAEQKPILDEALQSIPDALTVLKDRREEIATALDKFGKLGALTTDTLNKSKENLIKEFNDIGPVLESLADSGPALTRSASYFSTVLVPKENVDKVFRGDYANVSLIIDLTLSRLDAELFTGTRWEGDLTELELQWGRTMGQIPSPYTTGNPLVAPYLFNQGP